MKYVYVVLSQTGTLLSQIIQKKTHEAYAHASIAFDRELNELYSFGRLNPYNPFLGGMVHEGIHFGTFKRFVNTMCLVKEIQVRDDQYFLMKRRVENMYRRRNKFGYNYIGLVMASIGIPFRQANRYYCSEFVQYILDIGNVVTPQSPNGICNPMLLNGVRGTDIYTGLLQKYNKKPTG